MKRAVLGLKMALRAPLAAALLSIGVGACGSAAGVTSSMSHRPTGEFVYSSVPVGSEANGRSRGESSHGDRNDGDLDLIGDADGDNKADNDGDAPWDYQPEIEESDNYHDSDDATALAWGSPASGVQERAIAGIVTRYERAAAAGDGSSACALLAPSLAKAAVLDYGPSGPPYLRGAKSCRALTAALFEHSPGTFSASIVVTGVHTDGNHALALLGSSATDAGYITLTRANGTWAINALTSSLLP